MRRALVLVALTMMLAGCGGADERGEEAASGETTTYTIKTSSYTAERAVLKLVERYYEAYARADWDGVCGTLSPATRKRMDRQGGSCKEVFESTSTAKARKAVRDVRVRDVDQDGKRATITMEDSATSGVLPEKLYAAEIDWRWWLVIDRAAKGAP